MAPGVRRNLQAPNIGLQPTAARRMMRPPRLKPRRSADTNDAKQQECLKRPAEQGATYDGRSSSVELGCASLDPVVRSTSHTALEARAPGCRIQP